VNPARAAPRRLSLASGSREIAHSIKTRLARDGSGMCGTGQESAPRRWRVPGRHVDALIADSLGWEVRTWTRALRFWVATTSLGPGVRALEVGAGGANGGLSLWLAAQGCRVTCTDLEPPSARKVALHRAYGVSGLVQYACEDAVNLPHRNVYDLVVAKSVLGFIGQDDRFDLQQRAIMRMHDALRPGGELWIAENAVGTRLHAAVRLRHGAATRAAVAWRYMRLDEADALLAPFGSHKAITFATAAALGRTEWQRTVLALADAAILDRIGPPRWRYAFAATATR
jgi:SAM-dependent methyltransferase